MRQNTLLNTVAQFDRVWWQLADTSIGRLVTAFAGQSVDIPVWLAKVQIGGYDTAACTACGGTCTACFAYIAMATKKQTIETLTPPLVRHPRTSISAEWMW